ncbi:MAG: Rhamnosyl transferase, partial [uncultured Nocardioidaceae bacterium]
GGRHLQPRRPARARPRRPRRDGASTGAGLRRRQRQHRPHRRGPRPGHRPAADRDRQRGQRRGSGRLPPRHAARVRRGARPDLADGRRRGAGAGLSRCAPRERRARVDGGPGGPRGSALREGCHVLRPAQPAGDPAQAADRGRAVPEPRRDAGGGADRERRLRGLHGPPEGRRRRRAARPGVLHLLRRRGLRGPGAQRRVPRHGGAGRRPGPAARLRPAARHAVVEGLLHVPQPLRRAPALRRQPARPAEAVPDRARRRAARPAAGRPQGGGERVESHPGRTRSGGPAPTWAPGPPV